MGIFIQSTQAYIIPNYLLSTLPQGNPPLSKMNSNTNTNAATNNQQEDYLDKGLDAVEKKFGGSMGQNTEKNRGINEKITDGARNMFEKATGKNVPEKFSN